MVLARINVDISLADFEGGVRNLVSDTEQAYWELSFAWRNLETLEHGLEQCSPDVEEDLLALLSSGTRVVKPTKKPRLASSTISSRARLKRCSTNCSAPKTGCAT